MFDKVVKSTVPGQVIEQIKELLVKGELKRGDRLPPERQLADMLGVSRPSLREALRALEYAGMLETRVGEGIFVADGDSIMMNNLLMLHLIKQYALEEMIEVRKVLETSNVRFAVLRARTRISPRSRKFSNSHAARSLTRRPSSNPTTRFTRPSPWRPGTASLPPCSRPCGQ